MAQKIRKQRLGNIRPSKRKGPHLVGPWAQEVHRNRKQERIEADLSYVPLTKAKGKSPTKGCRGDFRRMRIERPDTVHHKRFSQK